MPQRMFGWQGIGYTYPVGDATAFSETVLYLSQHREELALRLAQADARPQRSGAPALVAQGPVTVAPRDSRSGPPGGISSRLSH